MQEYLRNFLKKENRTVIEVYSIKKEIAMPACGRGRIAAGMWKGEDCCRHVEGKDYAGMCKGADCCRNVEGNISAGIWKETDPQTCGLRETCLKPHYRSEKSCVLWVRNLSICQFVQI